MGDGANARRTLGQAADEVAAGTGEPGALDGEASPRSGLSAREQWWVTLTCLSATDVPGPIDDQVYAALSSGDLDFTAVQEFVLHFAVYAGWPKAAQLEGAVGAQWDRLARDNGREPEPWPTLSNDTLGENDWDKRIEQGGRTFTEINFIPPPPSDSPYRHAGVLALVFGHLWLRPGLTRRERRIISLLCVAAAGVSTPMRFHVATALRSGDLSKAELDELARAVATHHGPARAGIFSGVIGAAWARVNA